MIASQITGVSIVCSVVCSGADQRKHQSSSSLAFVGGIHRGPVDSPHKRPVIRKMFPFDDVIMVDHEDMKWLSMKFTNLSNSVTVSIFNNNDITQFQCCIITILHAHNV